MTLATLTADERLAVIGDIHGSAHRLRAVLDHIVKSDRKVIFVGDYINRGPDSRIVLEMLVEARHALGERMVLLRGNHEVALLQMLATGRPEAFLRHRGATTIRSYLQDPGPNVLQDFRKTFPRDHLTLLQETALCAEGPDLLISHAGYHPDRPFGRAEQDLTLGSWRSLTECRRPPRPLVVVGHYVQPSGRPFDSEHLIGIDTGCGTFPSAPLTVLLLPERIFDVF